MEAAAVVEANVRLEALWIRPSVISRRRRYHPPTPRWRLLALGVPPRWIPNITKGKYEVEGPDGEHTTWFFNSPTERCDYSLIGPREPGLIVTACGSSPVASLASPPSK